MSTGSAGNISWSSSALHRHDGAAENIRGLLQAYQLLPMETRMRYPLILSGLPWVGKMMRCGRSFERGTVERMDPLSGLCSGWRFFRIYMRAARIPLFILSFYGEDSDSILEANLAVIPVVCPMSHHYLKWQGCGELLSDLTTIRRDKRSYITKVCRMNTLWG